MRTGESVLREFDAERETRARARTESDRRCFIRYLTVREGVAGAGIKTVPESLKLSLISPDFPCTVKNPSLNPSRPQAKRSTASPITGE